MSETAPGTRAQTVIARLNALHPVLIDLSLGRLEHLLARLGHPERRLPPVINVAGTNGKGSTCAFLRAIGEASGRRVHVYTSPHLVRFNERIRIAGRLVSDLELIEAIEHLERINQGDPISVFEMITAAAFFLFAAYPADLAVIEVGLGGRFDATNVIPPPAAAAITSISLDHQEFLGDTLARIAFEKAGIIKPHVPVVTGEQAPEAVSVIANVARQNQAPLFARSGTWQLTSLGERFRFQDQMGALELPAPALPGSHQLDNAGIALAALGAAGIAAPESAYAAGLT
ncbi:MAG: bifunctional folylpolyglutamate synthase/dihydrofolate synthase, partial [Acetobacteraceae bacterium]